MNTRSLHGKVSVYGLAPKESPVASHTLSITVDNEPGVLARVIGLFSGRGYNIESLSVAETHPSKSLSRITVVCTGTEHVIEQIYHQLSRLVPVHSVHDLTLDGPHIERELALIRVETTKDTRLEALSTADIFRARVVDSATDSFVFEITGTAEKVNAFIDLMIPLGLTELCRTGIAAIARGKKQTATAPD